MQEYRLQFVTSRPVTGEAFFDRQREMALLMQAVESLKGGASKYYSLFGARKVGKSSLLREWKNRLAGDKDVLLVIVDCYEACYDPDFFFKELAANTINEFLIKRGYAAQTGLLSSSPLSLAQLAGSVEGMQALGWVALDQGLTAFLTLAENGRRKGEAYRLLIDLPEALAEETGTWFQLVFDEFQECANLNRFATVRRSLGDIFKVLRTHWQDHSRVNYIVAGSELSALEDILHSGYAPFFLHFTPLKVAEFDPAEARRMIQMLFSAAGRTVEESVLEELLRFTNGHPYYLQVLGEDMCRLREEAIDATAFKESVQEVFLGGAGILYLYFDHYFDRYTGTDPGLKNILIAISLGRHTVDEIAVEAGRTRGQVRQGLQQLLKVKVVEEAWNKGETRYAFTDPVFACWVQGTKSGLRNVAGPYLVGSETEKELARCKGGYKA